MLVTGGRLTRVLGACLCARMYDSTERACVTGTGVLKFSLWDTTWATLLAILVPSLQGLRLCGAGRQLPLCGVATIALHSA
jgi:hypothetical protein